MLLFYLETITTLKGKSSLLQEYVYQIWGFNGSDLYLGFLGYGTL